MNTTLVGLCLHLVLAQALFFDLLKDAKISRRKSSGHSGSSERRSKKKAEFVCSSSQYSRTTRRRYNCPTQTSGENTEKYSDQISGKNSQPCYDDNKYCASWAGLAECRKNPSWMLSHCPIACGLCSLCEDFNIYCEDWARRGECDTNRKYMKVYCKKSCSVCSSGLTPPTTTTIRPTTTTTTMSTTTKTTTRRPSRPTCRDRNYKCSGWARRGYCRSPRYYRYMASHCPRSCSKCHHQHP